MEEMVKNTTSEERPDSAEAGTRRRATGQDGWSAGTRRGRIGTGRAASLGERPDSTEAGTRGRSPDQGFGAGT